MRTRLTMAMALAFVASVAATYASRSGHVASPRQETARTTSGGSGAAPAETQGCGSALYQGQAPFLPAAQMRSTTVRCRVGYEILHSGLTRTPIWSAEVLTPQGVRAARDLERVDAFEPDQSLPSGQRSELNDYRRSGWDRGHMAPSGDMPTEEAQSESFMLSNIVPQSPELNRGSWARLESDVRDLALRGPATYVVTGVLFQGSRIATLPGGRVAIPTSMWKAVLVPGLGSIVMTADNRDGSRPAPTDVESFRRETGIDPFPAMAAADRTNALRLEDSDR
jgi:endonuclease G